MDAQCVCGGLSPCDPRDIAQDGDEHRHLGLARYEKQEAELSPLERAKRVLLVGDRVRFRDWRRPTLVHEGVVVGIGLRFSIPRRVRVQRAGYHDPSLVLLDDIVWIEAKGSVVDERGRG